MFALIVLLLLLGGGIGALVLSSQFGSNFIPPSAVEDGSREASPQQGNSAPDASVAAACRVPDVVGQERAVAEAAFTSLGIQPVIDVQPSAGVDEGIVIATSPEAGTLLEPCTGQVDVTVSLGAMPERPTDNQELSATDEVATTPTNVPTLEPTEIPGTFRDEFEPNIRPEWTIIQPGLNVDQGALRGDGIIFYTPEYQNYRIRMLLELPTLELYLRATPGRETVEAGYRLNCSGAYMGGWGCAWHMITEGETDSLSYVTKFEDRLVEDTYQELVVEVQGRTMTVFLDGEQFTSVADEQYTSGAIGLGATRALDVIEITPLP
jgi:hypothetical protein